MLDVVAWYFEEIVLDLKYRKQVVLEGQVQESPGEGALESWPFGIVGLAHFRAS